jgi:hypothetical protein
MNNGNIEVQVLVNGRPVREYSHEGNTYIEGREGTEYVIKVKNNGWYRVLAVPAIDGINVITGKIATPDDTGYIINAYSSIDIKGFRKDVDTVGSFKFSAKGQSYAAAKGIEYNAGVIGVIIFTEKYKQPQYIHNVRDGLYGKNWPNTVYDVPLTWTACSTSGVTRCANNASYTCKSNETACSDFNLGTTWGEAQKDTVKMVDFERGVEQARFTIYYTDKNGLVNMGINIVPEKCIAKPQAFLEFAEPPKGWKG